MVISLYLSANTRYERVLYSYIKYYTLQTCDDPSGVELYQKYT